MSQAAKPPFAPVCWKVPDTTSGYILISPVWSIYIIPTWLTALSITLINLLVCSCTGLYSAGNTTVFSITSAPAPLVAETKSKEESVAVMPTFIMCKSHVWLAAQMLEVHS